MDSNNLGCAKQIIAPGQELEPEPTQPAGPTQLSWAFFGRFELRPITPPWWITAVEPEIERVLQLPMNLF